MGAGHVVRSEDVEPVSFSSCWRSARPSPTSPSTTAGFLRHDRQEELTAACQPMLARAVAEKGVDPDTLVLGDAA